MSARVRTGLTGKARLPKMNYGGFNVNDADKKLPVFFSDRRATAATVRRLMSPVRRLHISLAHLDYQLRYPGVDALDMEALRLWMRGRKLDENKALAAAMGVLRPGSTQERVYLQVSAILMLQALQRVRAMSAEIVETMSAPELELLLRLRLVPGAKSTDDVRAFLAARAEKLAIKDEKALRRKLKVPARQAVADKTPGPLRSVVLPKLSGVARKEMEHFARELVDLHDRMRDLIQAGQADPETCSAAEDDAAATGMGLFEALRNLNVPEDDANRVVQQCNLAKQRREAQPKPLALRSPGAEASAQVDVPF